MIKWIKKKLGITLIEEWQKSQVTFNGIILSSLNEQNKNILGCCEILKATLKKMEEDKETQLFDLKTLIKEYMN